MPYPRKRRRLNNRRTRTPMYKSPRMMIVRPELKHFDVSGQSINVVSTGIFGTVAINPVVTGTTATTRIGDRITIKRIQVRFSISPAGTTDDGDIFRVIVLLDKQPNGANPAVLDVLQTADEQAYPANKTMKRMTFLMDRYIAWNVEGPTIGADPPVAFLVKRSAHTFSKNVNIEVEYILPSTATIAAISTNALHMFAISNQSADSIILWTSRISYVDY